MSIFSGKKGFIIRCVISFLILISSILSIKLFFSYSPLTIEQFTPPTEMKALLIVFYSGLFPAILLISSWVVLGSEIKGSLDNLFRFFVSSVLVFFILALVILNLRKQELLASMLADVSKKFDQAGRDVVIEYYKSSSDIFIGADYSLSILVLVISILYLYSFASFIFKAGKDALVKYKSLP